MGPYYDSTNAATTDFDFHRLLGSQARSFRAAVALEPAAAVKPALAAVRPPGNRVLVDLRRDLP